MILFFCDQQHDEHKMRNQLVLLTLKENGRQGKLLPVAVFLIRSLSLSSHYFEKMSFFRFSG